MLTSVKMSLENVAEEYFSKINPMATRLHLDMKETKAAYEDLWNNLPLEEQQQILTESIIKPEICLKYSSIQKKVLSNGYARKLIMDDNCSYRDEHSGPFSFKTASQRDLTIFEKKQEPVPLLKPKAIAQSEPKTVKLEFYSNEDAAVTNSGNSLPKTGLDFLDNW